MNGPIFTGFANLHYDWQALLVFVVLLIALTVIGRSLTFKVPALERMRKLNRQLDAEKLAQAKYPPVIRDNARLGLGMNGAFFLAVVPFFITLAPQSVWRVLGDTVLVLMVYDFFYYLTHRFLFHGQGYFRRVHALHHQARNPTHVDAYYVHPLETFVGILLFMSTIVLTGMFVAPFHAVTLTICFLVFTQLNIVNHTHIELPYFPFKTLNWITAKHAVHHENMHKGNYATITLLYDKLFGTLD